MSDLGLALRHWRDRVTPAMAGLPERGPRRAQGLRREELALLAGLSVDYVTRLEQGRATTPSVQVLSALTRTLRLSTAERDHLFALAGQVPPSAGRLSPQLTPGVRRMLDQLGTPVAVFDAAWTQLACNPSWSALFGELAPAGRERNVLWIHFTDPLQGVSYTQGHRERFEVALVSDLRSTSARYPDDDALRQLICDLQRASARFTELWGRFTVGEHESASKIIAHPQLGALDVDCDVLTVAGSDLRIVTLTAAPGSEAAEKLQLLQSVGARTMTTA